MFNRWKGTALFGAGRRDSRHTAQRDILEEIGIVTSQHLDGVLGIVADANDRVTRSGDFLIESDQPVAQIERIRVVLAGQFGCGRILLVYGRIFGEFQFVDDTILSHFGRCVHFAFVSHRNAAQQRTE